MHGTRLFGRSFERFAADEQVETNLHLPFAMMSSFAATNHLRLDPLTFPLKRTPSKAI